MLKLYQNWAHIQFPESDFFPHWIEILLVAACVVSVKHMHAKVMEVQNRCIRGLCGNLMADMQQNISTDAARSRLQGYARMRARYEVNFSKVESWMRATTTLRMCAIHLIGRVAVTVRDHD